jgi:hypothetical protein
MALFLASLHYGDRLYLIRTEALRLATYFHNHIVSVDAFNVSFDHRPVAEFDSIVRNAAKLEQLQKTD